MKTERLTWGLILVFIGSVILLENFGIIDFYWRSVWRLWPLFLIIIGADMLFNRGSSKTGTLIAAAIVIVALIFIGYQGSRSPDGGGNRSFQYKDDSDNNPDENDKAAFSNPSTFTEAFTANIRKAELNIKGGATSYTLEDTTGNLFDAEVERSFGSYSLSKISRDSVEILNFRMRNNRQGRGEMQNFDGNKARLRLNSNPVWDINIEIGAGKIDFDLTAFKVETLHLKGGAASFDVKLGQPQPTTTVNVETGVAEVDIEIPASAACRINVNSGFSSKDFEGFIKQSDGTYTTANFNSPGKKIIINLKGGLSKFEVRRIG